jgi:hypothetical protein
LLYNYESQIDILGEEMFLYHAIYMKRSIKVYVFFKHNIYGLSGLSDGFNTFFVSEACYYLRNEKKKAQSI